MNLDQILDAVFSQPRHNPAKDGDQLAAGSLAVFNLDAGRAIEAHLHAAVQLLVLTRQNPSQREALDSLDNLLLVAKCQVLESIHDAYHGRMAQLAEDGTPESEARKIAEQVHRHTFVGATLVGCIPPHEQDTVQPNSHDELVANIEHYNRQIETLAQAMQEHEARKEAGQPAH